MTATNVDIANGALAAIGEGPKVTALTPTPTGGPLAALCATLLPLARDAVLEAHPWSFASKRAELVPVRLAFASVDTSADTITFTAAHGLLANHGITLRRAVEGSGTAPGGLTFDVTYYVHPVLPSATSVALTDAAGTSIDITTSGSGSGTWLFEKASDRAGWAYAYATPSDLLRAVAVVPHEANDENFPLIWQPQAVWPFTPQRGYAGRYEPIRYERELNSHSESVIYTNQEEADLLYVAAVTDPSKFSPMFVEALTLELACRLAGAHAKNTKLRRELKQEMFAVLAQARASDASQRRVSMPDFHGWNRI